MGKATPTGYSADVRLWLRLDGREIPLSHTASTFVIPWEPADIPPGDAVVVVSIDGEVEQRPVRIIKGTKAGAGVKKVTVASRDHIAPF